MKNKKIVALSSSPSKDWNSDTILNAFIEGATTIPHVEVQKIYCIDTPCENYSFENRTGPQEHEHELRNLFDAIKSANGLVVATPTYNFSVPAGLKNIVDRLQPIALNTKEMNMLGQPKGNLHYLKTFFLVSGGTPLFFQKIFFYLFPPFWLSVVFKYYGARLRGSIYGGNLNATFRASENERLLRKARRAGARFAKKL